MFRLALILLVLVVLTGGCALSSYRPEKKFTVMAVQGTTAIGPHDYEAYVSAPDKNATAVPASLDLDSCHICINNEGWAYLWGSYPAAKGKRVRVVGTGTRFILETTDTADRVYFIPQWGDHALDLYRIDSTGETLLTIDPFDEAHYVQFDDSGAAPVAMPIRGSAFEPFVREVKGRVWSHDWPLGWPSW